METTTPFTYNELQKTEQTIPLAKAKIKNKRFEFDEATAALEFVYLGNDKEDESENYKEIDELVFLSPQTGLRYLNANNCSIKKIVIRGCPKLQTLFLFGNGMQEIRFEGRFPNLELIDLSRNALTRIELPAADFPKLKFLFLNGNKLVDLSGLASFFKDEDFDLNIDKNDTLVAPPKAIVEQGKDAVANYMKLLVKEQVQKAVPKYNFEAKLLIIGEGGTGKTTLKRKLLKADAEMPKKEDTTFGIDIDKWTFDIFPQLFPALKDRTQNEVMVNCWDFGGQKIYHGTHQIFFGENSYYILVADTREELTDFKYWFNTIEQLAGDDAQLLVIVNQKYGRCYQFDKHGFKPRFSFVDKDIAIDLNTAYDESDPETGRENRRKNQTNIEKITALQTLVKTRIQEMPIMGKPLSATYISVREDLFAIPENYIDFSKFREICAKHDVTDLDTIRVMSKYFTEIGAITHFFDNDLLRERVFLNSDWLVKTIYKVLDDSTIKAKNGRILLEDFCFIWQRDKLDFEISHLTLIMDKFGLMYQVPGSTKYIVPAHLPTQKPYSDWNHAKAPSFLTFKYEFDNYMPEGLMSHFIVALHTYIEDHRFVWHRGMNVAYENTFAEIIETYGGKNTFQIIIAGERKRELLAIIREKFKQILKPFKKLSYEELVPCNCVKCKSLSEPNYYDFKLLQEFIDDGAPGIQCKNLKKNVPIQQILDNVIVNKEAMTTNKIFISYSSAERDLRQIFEQRLKVYLQSVEYQYETVWSDISIPAGADWEQEIKKALQESNIGILLVSPMFLGSRYCMGIEFDHMLKQWRSEGYSIVPVLLRKCNFFNHEELAKNQFVKTYQSEYGVTDLILKNELMPFDKLELDKNEYYLNLYFLKITNAIDDAVRARNK